VGCQTGISSVRLEATAVGCRIGKDECVKILISDVLRFFVACPQPDP
jgi:hypothetical protein